MLNLIIINHIKYKIHIYAKDSYKAKYQFSIQINKYQILTFNVDLKHYRDLKAFIENSNNMQDAYENIEEYNQRKERKV